MRIKTIGAVLLLSIALLAILPIGVIGVKASSVDNHVPDHNSLVHIAVDTVDQSGDVINSNQLAPELVWSGTYGGPNVDIGNSVQQTSDGGYIATGGTNSFGAGSYDVYLVKIDASFSQGWGRTYGGSDWDVGNSVQQTSDGGYIVAGFTGSYGAGGHDIYLIKTDASGVEKWSRTYGGTDWDEGYSVQQTSDGGYIVTGFTGSYGAGAGDIYLIKTDASGIEEWSTTHGGSNYDWGNSVLETSDGGYIVAGVTESYGSVSYDVYLIKTDASGIEEWGETYGGSQWEEGYSVQQTKDGGYIVTGGTQSYGAGSTDVYLIKTDSSGIEEWSRTYGGSQWDEGYSVQQTSDMGYIVAGFTGSYGAGGDDVYLIKTDSSGIEEWSTTHGGSNYDWGNSVLQTSDGGYIVAGVTQSYGAGGNDIYVIKSGAAGP